MEKRNSPTSSVERALEILECFLDKDEMILLEIAEKTGLSSSTVLRILAALQEYDFVVRNPQNKTYRLGAKIAWLADRIPCETYEDLKVSSYPYMAEMNEKYNEDVRLFVPSGRAKLCIESVDSRRELRQVVEVGSRHDLVRGAAGKIILAYMPEGDRQKLTEGRNSSVDYEEVREKGYALSVGEREEGLFGLAVPILSDEGRLIAAVSMSGPTARFANENLDEKIQSMVEMGKKISREWKMKTVEQVQK